jgi:hypothetical protein
MALAIGVGGTSAGVAASPLTITVPGTLAIASNAAQLPAFFNAATLLHGATLAVTQAPTGAALVVEICLATSPTTVLFTLTLGIGDLRVSATPTQIAGAGTIPANTNLLVNITAVGSTFPGAGLTLNLF